MRNYSSANEIKEEIAYAKRQISALHADIASANPHSDNAAERLYHDMKSARLVAVVIGLRRLEEDLLSQYRFEASFR